jgi:hypothetical protein
VPVDGFLKRQSAKTPKNYRFRARSPRTVMAQDNKPGHEETNSAARFAYSRASPAADAGTGSAPPAETGVDAAHCDLGVLALKSGADSECLPRKQQDRDPRQR